MAAWERSHRITLGERSERTPIPTEEPDPPPEASAPAPRVAAPPPARRRPVVTRLLAGIIITLATSYGWFAGSNLFVSRAIPAMRGWQVVAVVSGSMEPALSPGDVLGYEPYRDQKVQPGTVIVFDDPARPGTLVTHRVVEVLPDGRLRTRGDANADPDSTPVAPDAILGVGRMVVPGAALPFYWWEVGDTTPFALWAAGSIVALLIAAAPSPGRRPRRRHRLAPALATVLALVAVAGVVTAEMRAEAAFTAAADEGTTSFSAFVMAHTGFVGEATCGGTVSVVPVTRSVPTGETIVVRMRLRDTSGSVATSATDSRGNSYAVDVEVADGTRVRVAILSARVVTALRPGDTITVTHRNNQASVVTAGGFSGVAATNRVVTTATETGNGTGVTIPVVPGETNTLLIGTTGTRNASDVTGTPGWTLLDAGNVNCGSRIGRASSWEILGPPIPMLYAPTFAQRERFAAAVVVYRAGA